MAFRLQTLPVFGAGLLVCAVCAIFASACRTKATGPPPRYAIVRFENLSGDPTLDWMSRAASESLSFSLAGAMNGAVLPAAALSRAAAALGPQPTAVPGVSGEHQRALVAGATRVIAGYIERPDNEIRIAATERDLATGKSLRIVSATGSSPIAAIEALAKQFSPNAKPPVTGNEDALRLYAEALESPIGTGVEDLEQATRIDPNFGEAWVALASLDSARGDRAAAEEAVDRARRGKLDALSLARLNLESANLQPDRRARIEALRKVVALTPSDTQLLRNLTDAEMAVGEFEAAAADWKKLAALFPQDPAILNSLGYALSYAGDYKDALAALDAYARLRPKDANPLDSIGDLNYSFGKFQDAANSYMRAHNLQPDFERYGDLYKAAWAKFKAGDTPAADKLYAQFQAEREKLHDPLIALITADWLYRTGRKSQAFDSLRAAIAQTPSPALRANGWTQITIWDLIGHQREQAAKDSASIGPKLTEASMLIARFAAFPSAPAEEWESRAEHLIPPNTAALRPMALGYALVLDGKRQAALPVWAGIVNNDPATDFFSRAIYARLQGKPIARPLLPDPANFNPFGAVPDSL